MTVGSPIGQAIGRPIGRAIGAGSAGAWTANFLAGEFPENIAFTRASNATDDSTGTLLTFGNNMPRLSTQKGLLLEGARTNLIIQSADLTDAAWIKTDTTITANNITSPDGGTNADLVTEGSAGNADLVQQTVISAGATHTQSVFLKRGNNNWFRVEATDITNSNGTRAWVNLATGALGTVQNFGTGTGISASIQSLLNGWYCVKVTTTIAAATTSRIRIISASADGSVTRVSNSTYYAWGGQSEQASSASSYIPTTGTAATRAADSALNSVLASIGFNPNEGTLLVEYELRSLSSMSIPLFTFSDYTLNNRLQVFVAPGGFISGRAVTAGVAANPADSASPITAGTVNKTAFAYGVGSNQVINCTNGTLSGAGSPASLPATATYTSGLQIGGQPAGIGTTDQSVWIRRLTYYPTRLPNAQLQALSTL